MSETGLTSSLWCQCIPLEPRGVLKIPRKVFRRWFNDNLLFAFRWSWLNEMVQEHMTCLLAGGIPSHLSLFVQTTSRLTFCPSGSLLNTRGLLSLNFTQVRRMYFMITEYYSTKPNSWKLHVIWHEVYTFALIFHKSNDRVKSLGKSDWLEYNLYLLWAHFLTFISHMLFAF